MKMEVRDRFETPVAKLPYVFTGVQIHRKDIVFIRGFMKSLYDSGIPHAFVVRYSGGTWKPYTIHNEVTSHCVIGAGSWQVLSLCREGTVHIATSTSNHIEHLDMSERGPSPLCWMLDIASIEGSVYAVGMARMVYLRQSEGKWVRVSDEIEGNSEDDIETGFRSISGFGERIFTVGLHGEIWERNNELWRRRDSPTNVTLHCVQCLSHDRAFACGSRGVILEMKEGEWGSINHDGTVDDLWALQEFQGEIYFSSARAIYKLRKDTLTEIQTGLGPQTTYGSLHAHDGVLWSVGRADLAEFDGERWVRINPPQSSDQP